MANENSNDLDLTLVSARASAKRLGLVDLPQMRLRKTIWPIACRPRAVVASLEG